MRRRAFTLVEILVVIGIVAFLSAFLVTSLSGPSRESARRKATLALVKRVELAVAAYRTELGTFPPDFTYLLTARTRTIVSGDASDPRNVRVSTVGPFLVLEPEHMSPSGKEILDEWGMPLHYDVTRTLGPVWSDNVNGE